MQVFEQKQSLTQNSGLVHSTKPDRAMPQPAHDEDPLLVEQEFLGNQAMLRFAQSCPLTLPVPSLCPTGGICHTCPGQVQTKLTVGTPGDKYEQEADRVAEEVMRMPESQIQAGESVSGKAHTPQIQRECTECEEEELRRQPIEEEEKKEEEETLQAKEAPGQTPVESNEQGLISKIMSNKGSGQGLDNNTRPFMEQRFGYDFSHVRLHTDSYAARKSNELNAEAFTIGSNIFFNTGRYNPSSTEGKSLLAHELAHVVQQESAYSLIQIQRFRDCTPAITGTTGRLTQAEIDSSIDSARLMGGTMALYAVNAMRGIRAGTGSTTAMAALANHFGTPTPGQVNTIFTRFENIQHRLANKGLFICNTAGSYYCKRGWCAYTDCPGSGHLTHLCPPFFQTPYSCQEGQPARAMVHEPAHAAGACNDDYPGAGYPPANAQDNAPSYAGFADEVMPRPTIGPPTPQRPSFPSLIEGIIEAHERRVRERVLESVEGSLLPPAFPGLESEVERVTEDIRRADQPLPYREAVELVQRAWIARNAPIVNVSTQIPGVTINHNLTGSQIPQTGTGGVGERAGRTIARLDMNLTQSTTAGAAVSGKIPFWLTNVGVTPKYSSITVYIAKEYALNTCEYRETLAHENEHVRVNRELLEEYAGKMRQALVFSNIPTQENPLSVTSYTEGESQTQAILLGILNPLYNELRQKLREANAALDTPGNYQQIHSRCSNW